MGDWEPDFEVTTENNSNSWNTALLWIIPAKVEGTWKMGPGELQLTQQFQMVQGTIKNGSKSSPIRDGRLRGDEITFTVNGEQYSGRVNGNNITGTHIKTGSGTKSDWMATRVN